MQTQHEITITINDTTKARLEQILSWLAVDTIEEAAEDLVYRAAKIYEDKIKEALA